MSIIKDFAEDLVKTMNNQEVVERFNKISKDKKVINSRDDFRKTLRSMEKEEIINVMMNSDYSYEIDFNCVFAYCKDGKINSFSVWNEECEDDFYDRIRHELVCLIEARYADKLQKIVF